MTIFSKHQFVGYQLNSSEDNDYSGHYSSSHRARKPLRSKTLSYNIKQERKALRNATLIRKDQRARKNEEQTFHETNAHINLDLGFDKSESIQRLVNSAEGFFAKATQALPLGESALQTALSSALNGVVADVKTAVEAQYKNMKETVLEITLFIVMIILIVLCLKYKFIKTMFSFIILYVLYILGAHTETWSKLVTWCGNFFSTMGTEYRYHLAKGNGLLKGGFDQVMEAQQVRPHSDAIIDSATTSWVLKGIFAVASIVFVKSLPSDKDFTAFLTKMDRVPKAIFGFEKMMGYISGSWSKISKLIKQQLGYKVLSMDGGEEEVSEWISKVNKYTSREAIETLKYDLKACHEIDELFSQGVNFMKRAPLMNSSVNVAIRNVMSSALMNLQKEAHGSPVYAQGIRVKPLCVYLAGESGVGKTQCVYPLAIDALKAMGYDVSDGKWQSLIYSRSVDQEFWDGYADQPVVIYDDFGQRVDSKSNPNLELYELIKGVNQFTFSLHMATLQEKANTRFNGKLLILTSNDMQIRVQSLISPEAIRNRISHMFTVNVKQQYRDDLKRLDKTKLPKDGNPLNLDVWDFIQYDPRKESWMANHSFATMRDMVCKDLVGEKEKSHKLKNFLNDYAGDLPGMPTKCLDRELKHAFEKVRYHTDCDDIFTNDDRNNPFLGGDLTTAHHMMEPYEEIREISDEEEPMDSDYDSDTDDEFDFPPAYLEVDSSERQSYLGLPVVYNSWFAYGLDVPDSLTREEMDEIETHAENRDVRMFRYHVVPLMDELVHKLECNHPREVNWFYYYHKDSIYGINGLDANRMLQRWALLVDDGVPHHVAWAAACYEYIRRLHGQRVEAHSSKLPYWRRLGIALHNAWKGYDTFSVEPSTSEERIGLAYVHVNGLLDYFRIAKEKLEQHPLVLGLALTGVLLFAGYFMYSKLKKTPVKATDTTYAWFGARLWSNLMAEDSPPMQEVLDSLVYPNKTIEEAIRRACATNAHSPDEEHQGHKQYKGAAKHWKRIHSPDEEHQGHKQHKGAKPKYAKIRSTPIDVEDGTIKLQLKLTETMALLRSLKPDVVCKVKVNVDGAVWRIESVNEFEIHMVNEEGTLDLEVEPHSDLDSQNILYKSIPSTYNLTYYYNDNKSKYRLGYGMMIRGSIMMIPYHYTIIMRENPGGRLVLTNGTNPEGIEVQIDDEDGQTGVLNGIHIVDDTLQAPYNTKDMFLFDCGRIMPKHKDLVKNWMSAPDFSRLDYGKCQFRSRVDIDPNVLKINSGEATVYGTPIYAYVGEKKEVVYNINAIAVPITTQPGDCGNPLIVNNKYISGKIAGILTNGCDNNTYFASITKEDLLESLTYFKKEATIAHFDLKPIFENETIPLPQGNFHPIGTAAPAPSAGKSKFMRSDLFGKILPSTKLPAKIRPFEKDGIEFDPLVKGLEKCGLPSVLVPQKSLHLAYEDVKRKLNISYCGDSIQFYKRVMTFEEAVRGIDTEEYIRALPRNTSAGYPWIFSRDLKKPGKETWLGKDDVYKGRMYEELRSATLSLIDSASRGERQPVIWIDCLKDELRPIEKVKAGKTRVFSVCPQHYSLAMRMYFLGFVAWIMKNRLDNEISVGINVFSDEWHKLALLLQTKGTAVIAGDFSNYDGSLSSEILWKFCDMANEFYGDSNQLIRKTLFVEIVNGVHIYNGNVYQWNKSLPSGNPFTAVINSVYNIISMRMVWRHITGLGMPEFNLHVFMQAYGDDNVLNKSEYAGEIGFTMENIMKAYKDVLSMTYTDELKSLDSSEKTLFDINYLKRKFVHCAVMNRYIPPLTLETILEMVNWVKMGAEVELQLVERVEVAFMELSLHGKEVFNKWVPVIYNALRSRAQARLRTGVCYEEYMEYWIRNDVAMLQLLASVEEPCSVYCDSLALQTAPHSEVLPYLGNNNLTARGNPVKKQTGALRLIDRVVYWKSYVTDRNYPSPATNSELATGVTQNAPSTEESEIESTVTVNNTIPDQKEETPKVDQIKAEGKKGGSANLKLQQIMLFKEEGDIVKENAVRDEKETSGLFEMMRSSVEDIKSHTVKDFLCRPMDFGTAKWKATDGALDGNILEEPSILSFTWRGGLAKTFNFPTDFISGGSKATTMAYDKMKGFKYFRGDLVFRIQVQAQPFQAGILRVIAFPYPQRLANAKKSHFRGATQITQLPHVELDISQHRMAELHLPHIGPNLFFDMIKGNGNTDIWSLVVVPYAQLEDVAATGEVSIRAFAYYKDVDIRFPNGVEIDHKPPATTLIPAHPVAFNPKFAKHTKAHMEAQQNAKTGTVGQVSGAIASVASKFSAVPGLGEYAAPVAMVANTVSGIANTLGFSKPTSVKDSTPIAQRLTGDFMPADGEDNGYSMAIARVNALDPMNGWAGSSIDEMAFTNIVTKPAYIGSFKWLESQTVETELFRLPVYAGYFRSYPVESTEFHCHTPVSYLANHFKFWRGSLKYTFKFVKTQFHSGRLTVRFVPFHKSTNTTRAIDYANCLSQTWDLAENSQYEFTVPFVHYLQMAKTPYGNSWDDLPTDDVEKYAIGDIVIFVNTELVAPPTVVNTIVTLVEMSGMPDLEFAAPTLGYSAAPVVNDAAPPSLLTRAHVGDKTIGWFDPAEERVFSINNKAIKRSKTASATLAGELVTSVRQLVKRYAGMSSDVIAISGLEPSTSTQLGLKLYPDHLVKDYEIDAQPLQGNKFGISWINKFYPLYAFRRGGIRLKIAFVEVDPTAAPFPRTLFVGYDFPEAVAGDAITEFMTTFVSGGATDQTYMADFTENHMPIYISNEGVASLEIPYYSNYHCLFNEYQIKDVKYYFAGSAEEFGHVSCMTLQLTAPSKGNHFGRIYRAGRDDFEFGFFLGTPLMGILHDIIYTAKTTAEDSQLDAAQESSVENVIPIEVRAHTYDEQKWIDALKEEVSVLKESVKILSEQLEDLKLKLREIHLLTQLGPERVNAHCGKCEQISANDIPEYIKPDLAYVAPELRNWWLCKRGYQLIPYIPDFDSEPSRSNFVAEHDLDSETSITLIGEPSKRYPPLKVVSESFVNAELSKLRELIDILDRKTGDFTTEEPKD